MPVYESLVSNNAAYVSSFDKGGLPLPPSKQLTVGVYPVLPNDAPFEIYPLSQSLAWMLVLRIPAGQLGINLGEAHIIRNAGGSAKEALRSIVISQRLLGTREIAVFHHTHCGMFTFTTDQLKTIVKDAAPGDIAVAEEVDKLDFLEISHLEDSVKEDVKFLKENPLVLAETVITGWTYDVRTGAITRVV